MGALISPPDSFAPSNQFFFCEIDGEYYSSLHFSTQGRLARNPCKPAVHLYLVAQTAIFQDIFPSEQSCSYLSPANRFVLKNTHTAPWFERLPAKFVWSYKRPGYVFPWEMFFFLECEKHRRMKLFQTEIKCWCFFRVQRFFCCSSERVENWCIFEEKRLV